MHPKNVVACLDFLYFQKYRRSRPMINIEHFDQKVYGNIIMYLLLLVKLHTYLLVYTQILCTTK